MQFALMLARMFPALPKLHGPVYATGILKGREAAKMIADFKAQETIHADHDRIISDAYIGTRAEDIAHINQLYKMQHDDSVSDAGRNWLEIEVADMEMDIVRNGLATFVHCPSWQPRPWPGEMDDGA